MNPIYPGLSENKMGKLADIIADPAKVGEISPDAIPSLLMQLASVQAALSSRLISSRQISSEQVAISCPDTLLTVEQAAKILNVTPHWLYSHAKHLPFARRLSRKVLRFSEVGIRKWQAVKKY